MREDVIVQMFEKQKNVKSMCWSFLPYDRYKVKNNENKNPENM